MRLWKRGEGGQRADGQGETGRNNPTVTRSRQDTRLDRLSPRERDVLVLMAEGLGNNAIAERLVVTDSAVHKHIRSIFAKLGLSPTHRLDRRVAAVLHYLEDARRRA